MTVTKDESKSLATWAVATLEALLRNAHANEEAKPAFWAEVLRQVRMRSPWPADRPNPWPTLAHPEHVLGVIRRLLTEVELLEAGRPLDTVRRARTETAERCADALARGIRTHSPAAPKVCACCGQTKGGAT